MMFQKVNKKRLILSILRKEGRISRYDITKLIKLSPSSTGNLVEELIKEGWVREVGPGDSTGGRKPILLELNPSAGYIVGIDFEAVSITALLVDFKLGIVSSTKNKIDIGDDKLLIVKKIIDSIHKVIAKSGVDKKKIMGIGLGVPGLIEREKGIAISYNGFPHWRDVPLKDLIELEFSLPTYIEKNALTMALAEKWFGLARRTNDFILLSVRSGIGSGIVIHGQLYRGVSGLAGEVGHMSIERNGPRCSCGNRGCLQVLASGQAILEKAKKGLNEGEKSYLKKMLKGNPERLTLNIIIEAALKGDNFSLRILEETGEYLGIAISSLIDLFNPQLIIIAGSLVKAGSLLLEKVEEVANKRALEIPRKAVKILLSDLGEEIGALGAATLVLQEEFSNA